MKGADTSRLRWVIWLLAAVILLPSAGLLWLVNRGMESERLAVRQRLEETYRHLAERAVGELGQAWQQVGGPRDAGPNLASRFHAWVVPDRDGLPVATVLLFDRERALAFPPPSAETSSGGGLGDDPLFRSAWRQEFMQNDPVAAAASYLGVGDGHPDPNLRLAGRASAFRCLVKAGQTNDACALAVETLSSTDASVLGAQAAGRRLQLKLRLAELEAETAVAEAAARLRVLLAELTAPEAVAVSLGERTRLLRGLVDLLEREQGLDVGPGAVERAGRALEAESTARTLAEGMRVPSRLLLHPERVVFALDYPAGGYGAVIETGDGYAVMVFGEETLLAYAGDFLSRHGPDEVHGEVVPPGETPPPPPAGLELARIDLGSHFPGWRAHWYAGDDQALLVAARRQTALYMWIGLLVVVLLVSAGAVSIRLVNREMRFHRLKNDFVATVTHELKTPLASTRVLVDTLLEKEVRDERQCTEYLEMIAGENHRLSSLIDRFLTFSRMERGKQTIEPVPCDPAELVRNAVGAAQMHFRDAAAVDVTIDPDLPRVYADPDAMVTVLINLLDNAFKYTGDEKQIGIHVSGGPKRIRFAVSDNGIGIPRRAWKRVFGKFYQVDQSLSRSVGGCGLGLSIVDFIVAQHRGKVEVESRVGHGSTFTVSLPAVTA